MKHFRGQLTLLAGNRRLPSRLELPSQLYGIGWCDRRRECRLNLCVLFRERLAYQPKSSGQICFPQPAITLMSALPAIMMSAHLVSPGASLVNGGDFGCFWEVPSLSCGHEGAGCSFYVDLANHLIRQVSQIDDVALCSVIAPTHLFSPLPKPFFYPRLCNHGGFYRCARSFYKICKKAGRMKRCQPRS